MTQKDKEPLRTKLTWRVEGDVIIITVPKGHDVYPNGKEIKFKAFTPTNMVIHGDEISFPNNDGITTKSLEKKDLFAAQIESLVQQFEEANKVIDDLQQLKIKMVELIKKMMPSDFTGPMNLESAALGKSIQRGDIIIPHKNEIRTHGFFFQGLEYQDRFGHTKTYTMALDSNGKYNYDPQTGFLYIAVN